jgi:hypothetical protein
MPNKILGWAASAGVLIACLLSGPAPATAWKVDSHVYAANLVLEEALSTLTFQEAVVTEAVVRDRIKGELRRIFGNSYGGRSRIDYLDNGFISWIYYPPQDRLVRVRPVMAVQVPPFGWLRLSEDMARALFYFPGLMRAGAVGPDLFPDLITGQTVVHPGEGPRSGRWAAYLDSEVRRIAGLYDGSPGSFDESPVLRAFYAGWLAHMAGDLFGHSWVNDYAGGVWPNISDGITNEEKNNILRHLIVEAYVSKKIPPGYLAGQRVTMDLPAGAALTGRYVMKWLTGNGGRIDHDDSEDDRFGINTNITGYAAGTPYHLDLLFSIRDNLRRETRNINWDALWAGFILQMTFGYFDFGQASLLYNHQWFHDVDTALDRLVSSQLSVARRMSAGEGFGAWFDELESWMLRYGLSALGLPDAVGRGIEMSGNAQEQITDAILPDEVEQAMSDLKRWFVDKVMEEAFGFTLTELERYLRDPGTYLTSRTLFPEGTKAKIDTELGNFAQTFSALECTRIDFVPFQNTLNMIKLQLVDPEELVRVLWTERALPRNLSTEEHIRAFVQTFFKSGIQMQFMGSLDAGYNWDRPDFAGCMLWDDPTVRQKIFHRIFRVARPGAGMGPALSVAAQNFEISFPESQFRPRFVWQSAASVAGIGAGGQAQAPPPPAAGTAVRKGVGLGQLPEMTFPDFGVVLKPRPFGQKLSVPDGIHVHAAALAFAEAPPPPPVVLRFFADAKKFVVDGKMQDAASVARIADGALLVPLDLVAKELGAGLAYDAAKGVATLDTPDGTYELRAGSADVLAGGQKKPLAKGVKTGPVAAATTLLVPPGFFEDHLGARVVSLEKDKTVVIERRKFADDAPSTVTGEPAAADAAAPAAAGGPSSSPWSGKWETTIGAMDIVVAADGAVDFNYDGAFGRLEGRISGTRLTGRFTEDNGSRGEIVLTLGREDRTFTGQWRRTDLDDDYWHGCEGWRPFEEEAGAAPSPAPAGADEAASSSWAGSWDTSIGDMVLRAEAGAVKGGYDGTFGRIEGKASGPKLAGRFYEDNGNWGEFEFVLDPDGQAFKGRWRRLNVENDDWHACEGRRPEKTG